MDLGCERQEFHTARWRLTVLEGPLIVARRFSGG